MKLSAKCLLPIATLAFTTSLTPLACAQSNPGDLIKQAVAAEGGVDALRGLKGLAIKGDAKFWEPGQSYAAGGEPRFLGDATFAITWDVAKGVSKTDWDRDQKYPEPIRLKYTETLFPSFGVNSEEKGAQPMSRIRVAALLRELERASPQLLLNAMNDPSNVLPLDPQPLGKASLPAVSFTDKGTKFTILFDRETHLPAAVRTRDDDNIHGDSNYDLVLSDWKTVGGAKLAEGLSYQIGGVEVAKLNYREVAAVPSIPDEAFAVPEAVKAVAPPPATGNVPYQWVLRRLFLTRFLDSDNVIYPNGGNLKLVELAPNVQHVEGGTANNLIVAMKDYLVIFDAPYGELQSRWTIDAAKAKYPGKPIKYLVLTHHHMDHTGGMRTYVAEGATVIVPAPDKAYFEQDVAAARTLVPDDLQKKPAAANIIEVKDEVTIKDEADEIRLFNINNPHVQGFILGYVVKSNVLYVTDLISPRGVINRSVATVAVGDAVRKFGINPTVVAGGHGTTAKVADLTKALAAN